LSFAQNHLFRSAIDRQNLALFPQIKRLPDVRKFTAEPFNDHFQPLPAFDLKSAPPGPRAPDSGFGVLGEGGFSDSGCGTQQNGSCGLREIEAGEGAYALNGGEIVMDCRFSFIGEPAKMNVSAINSNPALPLLLFLIPVDAYKTRRTASKFGSISVIFGLSRMAEIRAAIIQPVTIDVINLESGRGRKDN
jgi:hypothetical protein